MDDRAVPAEGDLGQECRGRRPTARAPISLLAQPPRGGIVGGMAKRKGKTIRALTVRDILDEARLGMRRA